MFRKVGSLIKLSPRYRKSEAAVSAIMMRQIAGEVLGSMCRDYPEDMMKKIRPTTYKNGVLTIVCPPIASGELYMRSGELIDIVNKKIGVRVLRSVRFRSG